MDADGEGPYAVEDGASVVLCVWCLGVADGIEGERWEEGGGSGSGQETLGARAMRYVWGTSS